MKSDEISQSSLQIHEQELRQLNEEVRMLKEVNNKLIEGYVIGYIVDLCLDP